MQSKTLVSSIGDSVSVYYFDFFSCLKLKEELQRTNLELESFKEKIKENQEKIKLNKQLPYLVGNIVEVNFFCSISGDKNLMFWNKSIAKCIS